MGGGGEVVSGAGEKATGALHRQGHAPRLLPSARLRQRRKRDVVIRQSVTRNREIVSICGHKIDLGVVEICNRLSRYLQGD